MAIGNKDVFARRGETCCFCKSRWQDFLTSLLQTRCKDVITRRLFTTSLQRVYNMFLEDVVRRFENDAIKITCLQHVVKTLFLRHHYQHIIYNVLQRLLKTRWEYVVNMLWKDVFTTCLQRLPKTCCKLVVKWRHFTTTLQHLYNTLRHWKGI